MQPRPVSDSQGPRSRPTAPSGATTDQADGLRRLMGVRAQPKLASLGVVSMAGMPLGQALAQLAGAAARTGLVIECVPAIPTGGQDASSNPTEVLVWTTDNPTDLGRAVELSAGLGLSHLWLVVSSLHRERGRAAARDFAHRMALASSPSEVEVRFLGVIPSWSDRRAGVALDRILSRLTAALTDQGAYV